MITEMEADPVPYKCDECDAHLMTGTSMACAQCAADVFVCRGETGCLIAWEIAETPYVCSFCRKVQGWPGADGDVAPDVDADLPMVTDDDLIADGLGWAPDPADGDNEGADL